MNSEAIKILTPLLPIKPLIDFVVSPFLPLVFEAQFGFCYSFTPSKESITDSLSNANAMAERHRRECRKAWQYHEGVEDQSIEPRISS
jgi:zeaxanthin epoxidase